MRAWIKLRLYWAALVVFWLFAVYSTSIWKSFDQRLTVSVMQNIETVKAFNTFLDDTIIASTQKVIEKTNYQQIPTTEQTVIPTIGEGGSSDNISISWETLWTIEESSNLLPTLDTLKTDAQEQVKLVDQGTKRVQLRNNYVLFRSQIRNLFVALIAVVFVFFLCVHLYQVFRQQTEKLEVG